MDQGQKADRHGKSWNCPVIFQVRVVACHPNGCKQAAGKGAARNVWQSQPHMRCVQCQRWRPRLRRPRRCRRCTRSRLRACTRPRASGRRSRRRRRARPRRCASCCRSSRRKRASWPCRACARPCASPRRRARCRRASSCWRACVRRCASSRCGSRRPRAACSSRRRGARPAAGGCRAGPAARPAPPARTASSPPSTRCARMQARGIGFNAALPISLLHDARSIQLCPAQQPRLCLRRLRGAPGCLRMA